MRERGLKSSARAQWRTWCSRSREGAWIEISYEPALFTSFFASLPWGSVDWNSNYYYILYIANLVAPVRERGLKYYIVKSTQKLSLVAPVRERGLKYIIIFGNLLHVGQSLPWGSVDWNSNSVHDSYFIFCRSREGAWIEIKLILSWCCKLKSLPWGSVDWNILIPPLICKACLSLPWGSVDWNTS